MRIFPYKKLSKYPHLMPNDVAVWEKFIDVRPLFFTGVDYDVRVGKGAKIPKAVKDKYDDDFVHLTKKRVDVVGYSPDKIHVIEVKPVAGLSAVGQAIGCFLLFSAQTNDKRQILPCIITNKIDDDTRKICQNMNVVVFIA